MLSLVELRAAGKRIEACAKAQSLEGVVECVLEQRMPGMAGGGRHRR